MTYYRSSRTFQTLPAKITSLYSTDSAQSEDSCLSLKFYIEKLESLEAYFLKTTTKNIQIFDNFVVVGKLEALQCVRPDFTKNLIQSYLQRVDETDISGLKYYQSKLASSKLGSKTMTRRPVAIVWLFAITLIAGSRYTLYTAKLSLELASEQENFKRSSIRRSYKTQL